MQYTKLGFNRLFKGCGLQHVLCSLIGNRSVTPTLHIATVIAHFKKRQRSCNQDIIVFAVDMIQ
jgi:hypothetical protein